MATTQTRTSQLELVRLFHHAVRRAADATREDQALSALCAAIRENERGHRAFGHRLLGHRPPRRLTIDQCVDLFVARTIAEALSRRAWKRRLAEYRGIREDYMRAAMMTCNDEFRGRLIALLPTLLALPLRRLLKAVADVDYSQLI